MLFDVQKKRCATPDLEAASVGAKCGAVDCGEKYFGAKDVFDAKTGRCEKAPECFFDENDLTNAQVRSGRKSRSLEQCEGPLTDAVMHRAESWLASPMPRSVQWWKQLLA